MDHLKKQTITALFITAAALALSGCAASPADAGTEPVKKAVSTRYHANRWGNSVKKYTKDDYDFLLAFRTEGYEKMPVEEFNKKVLDWENEESYHKTEDILEKIFCYLPEDDKNADFLLVTLGNTWNECEKKHFNSCEREKAPWHSGYAAYETYGDVFGDRVLLSGGYADLNFDYSLDAGKNLTVAGRDELLDSVGTRLEEYMKKQSADALKKEEAMEKTLSSKLKEILKSIDGGIVWGGNSDLDYYWEAPYEEIQESYTQDTSTDEEDEMTYTKAQYQLVMEKLKPENYEQMSVSEYNRMINKAFSEDSGDEDGVTYAYEMVMSSLSEKDKNWAYLNGTVQRALDEYHTRTLEVYTGKTKDFKYTGDIHVTLKDDVFGDQMEVGDIEGEYEFTYRIADADKLTVKDREAFIKNVNQKALESLEKAAEKGNVDQAGFKKILESAGKDAGSNDIEFTGCSLEYFEVYR